MICSPCAQAADAEAEALRTDPDAIPVGHAPELCRDQAIHPHGCTCQHQPIRPRGDQPK